MSRQNRQNSALKGLAWPLRLTRLGMVSERVTRAYWPLWAVLMLAVAALMLGAQDAVPVWAAMTGLLAFAVAILWTLIAGNRRMRWPTADDASERLDQTLTHHPIAALADTQAIGADDAASKAVWQAHLAQMAARLKGVKPAPADLRVSGKDPYALRYMATLAFLVALLFGSITRVGSLADIATGQGGGAQAAGPSWEGWIEPPVYTGKPSLYLNDQPEGDLPVPKGSRIILRFYGEVGALSLRETVSGNVLAPDPDRDAISHELVVVQGGVLLINGPGGSQWKIALLPDMVPDIRFDGDMQREARGVMRQPFAANDDYAVVRGQAEFRLDLKAVDRRYGLTVEPELRKPILLDLPLPISGDRSDFTEELVDDLSEHPWSGLPVTLTLTVEDALKQMGHSKPSDMLLPGRRFFDPLAAAVIEQRRDLLWSRENGKRVAQVLRAVSHRPEGFVRADGGYLMLRVAIRRLEFGLEDGLSSETRDEIAQALWEIALVFEDGSLSDALERLHRAQDRLSEAMRNGASDEEIADLMRELREATQDYLRQLAEQQRENGGSDQQMSENQNRLEITQDELQALMDRIQELMEQGRMAEAQELMQQLNELMENLQVTENQQGGPQSPGQQSMEDLQNSLRNQQGLSDEAFRDLQEQFNQGAQAGQSSENEGQSGGQGRGQSHEGQGGEGQAGGQEGQQGQSAQQSLADRQKALRDELRRQREALPGAGTAEGDAARDALERAGRAMEGAEDALRNNDLAEALDNQAKALEALREGMRDLGEALARNQQNNPGRQGDTQGRDNANALDPLGRENGGRGRVGTQKNMLQGEDVYRRARELLDELRRRSGDKSRPDVELDYLNRLLDRF